VNQLLLALSPKAALPVEKNLFSQTFGKTSSQIQLKSNGKTASQITVKKQCNA